MRVISPSKHVVVLKVQRLQPQFAEGVNTSGGFQIKKISWYISKWYCIASRIEAEFSTIISVQVTFDGFDPRQMEYDDTGRDSHTGWLRVR